MIMFAIETSQLNIKLFFTGLGEIVSLIIVDVSGAILTPI